MGIAGIASVPVRLAINLYGLKHGGQTGRGEQNVRCNGVVPEHVTTTGPNIGGVTNGLVVARATRSKSIVSARISRNGFFPIGLSS